VKALSSFPPDRISLRAADAADRVLFQAWLS
jgi:hypothetical protein